MQVAGLEDGDGFALLRRHGGDAQPGQHGQDQRQREELFARGFTHKMTSRFFIFLSLETDAFIIQHHFLKSNLFL